MQVTHLKVKENSGEKNKLHYCILGLYFPFNFYTEKKGHDFCATSINRLTTRIAISVVCLTIMCWATEAGDTHLLCNTLVYILTTIKEWSWSFIRTGSCSEVITFVSSTFQHFWYAIDNVLSCDKRAVWLISILMLSTCTSFQSNRCCSDLNSKVSKVHETTRTADR